MPFFSTFGPRRLPARWTRLPNATALAMSLAFFGTLAGCGSSSTPTTIPTVEIGVITITAPAPTIELGYHAMLTAAIRDRAGVPIVVPVVWRSLNEKIISVDANGRIAALDTGTTLLIASSLGVNSTPVAITVVNNAAASITLQGFTPNAAISPGATPDSLRVLVTNKSGAPVAIPTRVAFAVTSGGGTVSPAIATTNAAGIASAQLITGKSAGVNRVTATILGEDDKVVASISTNPAIFTIRTFSALLPAEGNNQSGQILEPLAIQPSVKLVDSTGKVRPGVPVTFTVGSGGRIEFSVVATGADGTASPGKWTLGDTPGEQLLMATVDLASTTLVAVGTGTPVRYEPATIVAGSFATCGIELDGLVKCMGEEPKVGDSSAVNKTTPTPTKGDFKFATLAATPSATSHFCGVSLDGNAYCWGLNSFPDTAEKTSTFTSVVPARTLTDIKFSQVVPGQAHNCGLGVDQNVYCWGDNSVGQLGDRSNKVRYVPAIVTGGFKFQKITAGGGHTCGVTLDNMAVCWGFNAAGQLGNGTTASSSSPTTVTGGFLFKAISAGDSFTCALTMAGRPYCWGNLNTGSAIVTAPRAYPDAPAFESLSAGGFHVCALTADGSAYCWGQNSVGQLGDSTIIERANPTKVVTTIKFKSISAGFGETCGKALDGAVACWGFNKTGELGDSSFTIRSQPRFITLKVTPAGAASMRPSATSSTTRLRGLFRP